MASNKVQIWNIALARVGSTERVQSENEGSLASDLCATFYDTCRDFVLEDFPWRFAKKRITLALKAGTPPGAWLYQYALPSDCVCIRCITNPLTRTPLANLKIPFERATDGASDLIFTDMEDAELIYTCRVTDVSRYDASFLSSLAFNMAMELAIPLMGAQKGGPVAQAMDRGYNQTVRIAAAKSLNEGFDTTPDNEFLAARNG